MSKAHPVPSIVPPAVSAGGLGTQGGRTLAFVWGLTAGTFVVEVLGGWWSNSLALIADAFHMLTDLSALSLSLLAFWIARRPATAQRTFGYYRVEILVALLNASLLAVTAGGITWRAWERLHAPVTIQAPLMFGVATVGLVVNFVGIGLLHRYAAENLNLRTALLHIASDAFGSVGALTAALAIWLKGWTRADAVVSLGLSGLILYSALRVIREAVHILMEGTPRHIDLEELRRALLEVQGIQDVHDLHVWTVTPGVEAMSGHAVVEDLQRTHEILTEARRILQARFHIQHVTLQIECCDFRPTEPEI
ncbi:MAG: cation diffusion facilitator family transporter [Acidobacteria bacterium]|nr:cation diffusion facilitator family transporter [Acidobacteriota bacterium]MDW7983645.1 cation diffusion facilitator family transporter [Acidobacteriota bacterium]